MPATPERLMMGEPRKHKWRQLKDLRYRCLICGCYIWNQAYSCPGRKAR